nr:MAG TPA_asm: hypothetical protein [Caudoviricetes sp.]
MSYRDFLAAKHHQWMNDPDAWRRQIEGNER